MAAKQPGTGRRKCPGVRNRGFGEGFPKDESGMDPPSDTTGVLYGDEGSKSALFSSFTEMPAKSVSPSKLYKDNVENVLVPGTISMVKSCAYKRNKTTSDLEQDSELKPTKLKKMEGSEICPSLLPKVDGKKVLFIESKSEKTRMAENPDGSAALSADDDRKEKEGLLDDVAKELYEEAKVLHVTWLQGFCESEKFEQLYSSKLDELIKEASSVEESLQKQKELLFQRLNVLCRTLQTK